MSVYEPNAAEIVGADRDVLAHIARAVTATQTITILHSQNCLNHHDDLRECSFSDALDLGIDEEDWQDSWDRPVVVEIDPDGILVPFPKGSIRGGDPRLAYSRSAEVQQMLNRRAESHGD